MLVGSNTPHMWLSGQDRTSIVRYLHINPVGLSEHIQAHEERNRIRLLLERAKRGMHIKGRTASKIRSHMLEIEPVTPKEKIEISLHLLDELSLSQTMIPTLFHHHVLDEETSPHLLTSEEILDESAL